MLVSKGIFFQIFVKRFNRKYFHFATKKEPSNVCDGKDKIAPPILKILLKMHRKL